MNKAIIDFVMYWGFAIITPCALILLMATLVYELPSIYSAAPSDPGQRDESSLSQPVMHSTYPSANTAPNQD